MTEEGKKETGKLLLISVISAKDANVAPLHEGGSESRTGRQSGFGGNPDWNQLVSFICCLNQLENTCRQNKKYRYGSD